MMANRLRDNEWYQGVRSGFNELETNETWGYTLRAPNEIKIEGEKEMALEKQGWRTDPTRAQRFRFWGRKIHH